MLLRRKQCLRPTLAGWLIIAIILGASAWLLVAQTYAFLAPNKPLDRNVLVIAGWLDDVELSRATERLDTGNYRFAITTGGPIGIGGFLTQHKSYAGLALATLQKIGLSKPAYAVPALEVVKDRTYASALALKQWLVKQHPEVHSFDLLTAGPHARRSQLLYLEAFGDAFQIGIIALPPSDYDASRWWTSSVGVRTVIGEAIAWAYAAFFFSPAGELG